MSLRRAAVAMAPKLLRSNNGAQHSAVGWGAVFGHIKTTGTCGGDFIFAPPHIHIAVRSVTTSSRLLDKAGDSPNDSGAAAARRAAVRDPLMNMKGKRKTHTPQPGGSGGKTALLSLLL